jgi:cytochrome c-type protein NapB
MNKSLLLALAAALGCSVALAQGKAVTEREMGLSRTDVFETPVQQPYALDAGSSRPAPLGTPPVIVHPVESMLPIKVDANQCLACHDKPALQGKKVAKGQPQPAPASHYLRSPGTGAGLSGAYYDCMLCHAPQANVKPLVGTTSR